MQSDPFKKIVVFCDGACTGNPGPGGWGAIIAAPGGDVWEIGNHAPETTNNRMELVAAASALEAIQERPEAVNMYTDSVYVIRGITEWIFGWRKRGWKNAAGDDVANQDLWQWLSKLTSARKGTAAAEWHYVRGHVGIPGNERADEIAVAFAARKQPELFNGKLLKYGVPIHDIPADTSIPEMKERAPKVAAHSYISLVDGILRRHSTWADCERLVKGRSGAKFKKTTSASDERAIVEGWGRKITDISG